MGVWGRADSAMMVVGAQLRVRWRKIGLQVFAAKGLNDYGQASSAVS
jgi:hypothetical protein